VGRENLLLFLGSRQNVFLTPALFEPRGGWIGCGLPQLTARLKLPQGSLPQG